MSSPKSATLIDRDELLATLEQDINVSVTGEENMEAVRRCLQEILDDVKNSPVVDAVPVRHGKWKLIRMEDNGDGFYTCSNCDRGDIHSPLVTVPYCWYCGARMDEE